MATPYIHSLSDELRNIDWSLCQLHMRSSYTGFGTGSLKRDFEDISAAIAYLLANGKYRITLMGHSTGSQDSIHYVLNQLDSSSSPSVAGVIVPNLFMSL
jgi:predicted alpha/beta-fold hydrolase